MPTEPEPAIEKIITDATQPENVVSVTHINANNSYLGLALLTRYWKLILLIALIMLFFKHYFAK